MRIPTAFFLIACTGQVIWAQSSPPLCTLQNGGEGGCVPIGDCNPATNTMYDDGSGIFSPRLGLDRVACFPSQVCCSFPPAQNPGQGSEVVTKNTGDQSSEPCGIQKRQTVAGFTKTKANEADPGEFPWTVNLMILARTKENKGVYHYSGTGSLIHDRVVLTAAHVLQGKALDKLRVIPGEHDQRARVLLKKLVEVTDVVIHKDFNNSNGNNNIALVFLKSSATKDLVSHVGTVCLPPANYVPTPGSSCVFSGWGINSTGSLQNQLSKTEVPMVSHSGCQERMRQSPKLGPGFQLLPTFTCAGGEAGKDICAGGGGSPLVCPIEGQNRYIQTGIVSWVVDCGEGGYPVVFTDVAVARPWIDQQMADHQYSTASYTY